MNPWLSDPDVDIYVGDALEVLRGLPDGSVDCCVTSPPYWGLRDYGTGSWDGGNADCDHVADIGARASSGLNGSLAHKDGRVHTPFRDVCGKCGAQRVDRQLGLEATPDLYVAAMVAVFAEVRRVLADHGTLWLNIGDTYHGGGGGNYGSGLSSNQGGQHLTNVRNRVDLAGLKPKDLCGIPWRLAFALQADGWWLRSDIIWAKPNPMPESVTDRPTKAHEYVFLLSKRPSYWFDAEAVREQNSPATTPRPNKARSASVEAGVYGHVGANSIRFNGYAELSGRNVRSVWEIATQPYPEAHFATFPEELPRRAILAGCPVAVCSVCGKARERIVERELVATRGKVGHHKGEGPRSDPSGMDAGTSWDHSGGVYGHYETETVGWSDCAHGAYRPGRVLDPFLGSGTTAHVARKHGRRCVGIELNETYAQLAARRLQQLSLLAEGGYA